MATYVYETIPLNPDEPPERFEVVQSMKAPALKQHPTSGAPVRRVVMGGFGLMGVREKAFAPATPACSPGCACHSNSRLPAL